MTGIDQQQQKKKLLVRVKFCEKGQRSNLRTEETGQKSVPRDQNNPVVSDWAVEKKKNGVGCRWNTALQKKNYITVYNFGYNTQCSKSFPNKKRTPIQSNGGS